MNTATFLIQCPDKRGLISRISTFFFERGFNVLQCQQYTDVPRGRYYMRLKLDLDSATSARRALEDEFRELGNELELEWSVHYSSDEQRAAILCTKTAHCVYDLLVRQREGELRCLFPVIISNHPDLEHIADQFKVPFHCLPVRKGEKEAQEAELLAVLQRYHIDLVILARYMQVLSQGFIEAVQRPIINIHHAVLPAFQGANPYERAYARGVKMIGATAHYATKDLDEGPIIEQDIARVSHEESVADLKRIGRDIERIVLARAVKAHLERRIIVAGARTVVFSGL